MKILVGIDIHFEGYGGPYYAISNKLHNLSKNELNLNLYLKKTVSILIHLIRGIVEDFDIIHLYSLWQPFIIETHRVAKKK